VNKPLTYLLILAVSFVYSYETISLLVGSEEQGYAFCEESSPESEESSEKSEKEAFDNDEFFSSRHFGHLLAGSIEVKIITSEQDRIFSSSDYSAEVFSPPEVH
jgi:hypothetical protein